MNSVWAVAKNTIKQAFRMKVAVVFVLLLIILLPVLGVSVTGDETLKGRLQTFVSYGLSLTSFLLCLLTIAISIYTVTNDIKQKQVFTVITKPIRRFEFLTGKLLGVLLLDLILLFIFSAIIYSITIYMPKYYRTTPEELAQANNEFFTARAGLPMPKYDFTEAAKEFYKTLESEGELPDDMTRSEILNEINNRMQLASRMVDIGDVLYWEFENITPLAEDIFIKFKYEVLQETPDSQVYARWIIGDPYSLRTGEPTTPIYDEYHKNPIEIFQEIKLSARYIPESGNLGIIFMNDPSNDTVVLFPQDGIEVLFKADSFTWNFIRSIILILSRLVFLACLGILTATFVSFPVAILLCLVLFFTSNLSGFVLESFDFLSQNVGMFYKYTLKWMVQLLPQFDKYNPTKFLVPARLLSWPFLAQCIFFMVCIKAFLLLILAFLIFTYREIAKIIV